MSIQEKLQAVFKKSEIEFKAQATGTYQDGNPWVQVASYVQARAIQQRLDECFGGFEGWDVAYRETPSGVICRLKVHHNGREVIKEDGAELTGDIGAPNALKGGCSGALKRVASSGYGIGRYLYNLPKMYSPKVQWDKPKDATGWSSCKIKIWNKQQKKNDYKTAWWQEPILPYWAYEHDDESIKTTQQPKQENKEEKLDSSTGGTRKDSLREIPKQETNEEIIAEAEATNWVIGKNKNKSVLWAYQNDKGSVRYLLENNTNKKHERVIKLINKLDDMGYGQDTEPLHMFDTQKEIKAILNLCSDEPHKTALEKIEKNTGVLLADMNLKQLQYTKGKLAKINN